MFNLENAIKEWKKSLRKNEALEDGYIAELESHLRDEVENGTKEGKEEEAAFLLATKKLGEADLLGEEFYKTDTTHINKRPPWKESKWMPMLLSNYLKVAKRNIFRQKGYSFLNITGLALGMACCILLLLKVYHEHNYDKFHKKARTLYRVELDQKMPQGKYRTYSTSYPTGPAIKENIPEVINYSRWCSPGNLLVINGDKVFFENTARAVDPSFLQMFSFPLIYGNSTTALNNPFSIILSETMAKKYYGIENPVGKTLTINNKYLFSVTGVMKDTPLNSTLRPDMFFPLSCMKEMANASEQWGDSYLITWVELNNSNQIEELNKKITNLIMEKRIGDAPASVAPEQIKKYRESLAPDYVLMPLTDINLYGYSGFGQSSATINSLNIFMILASFILLIACINYMNLATARAVNRAKEIGLRKTIGAERRDIISQFFSESMFLAIISFAISFLIAILLLPLFNDLTGSNFTIGALFNTEFLLIMAVVAVAAGIISGSYPALFLSSFSPIKVLKGNMDRGSNTNIFRKSLVIFQFSISVILVIGTIVAFQQLQYMRTKKVGYEKDHLIYIQLREEAKNSYLTLKQELLKTSSIISVSGIDQIPTNIGNYSSSAKWDGKDPNLAPQINTAGIDNNFIETMEIEIIEGSSFSNSISTDPSRSFLVNEEVLKIMGVKSAAGKNFSFRGVDGNIAGVMKNFHYTSAAHKIEPLVLVFSKTPTYAVIRIKGGSSQSALEDIKSIWKNIVPAYPFEYKFIDDDFAKMYTEDEQMGNIFKYGAIFAILIAGLGLFGFASFMAEKRRKEIGIRKTLGASISGITILLSREFIKWVVIANVIAWPISYVLTNIWLQDYAYRISVKWWVFIVSGAATVLIAVLTVGFQAIRAASVNPVNSLRSE